MDVVRGPEAETIARAQKEHQGGNYRGALALLLPLLRAKDKLSPRQEHDVVAWLTNCYRGLGDDKAALPHAQRMLVLAQEHGPRSLAHAGALKGLCMVHTGLKAFPAAREAIVEALAIMDELGLQQHEQYGAMLMVMGRVDDDQGRYKEALVIYNKAKAVLVQYKEGNDYGVLLNNMAICHKELHQWNEAVACYKETIEHHRNLHGTNHPEYAAALNNLAMLFGNLKQYDEAVPRFEEVLTIYQRVYGKTHQSTVDVAESLAVVRLLAQQRYRDLIYVGHNFGMCNQCGKVEDQMSKCNGCNRAWYCNEECQLLHWPTHKPQCDVCMECGTVLTKILRCSCCMKAKYCGPACSKAHWNVHKKECRRATNK